MKSTTLSPVLLGLTVAANVAAVGALGYYSSSSSSDQNVNNAPGGFQHDLVSSPALSTVGGATAFMPEKYRDIDSNGESIDYDFISKILRLTCEMNRQLRFGIPDEQCHDTTTSQQPPGAMPQESPVLTLFHSETERTKNGIPLRGVERWGPNLNLFLRKIQSSIGGSETCVALALIYLDRACSADINRNTAACPYLTPRTVHKMLLTSMVIAAKALGHEFHQEELLDGFGIGVKEFQGMEDWMIGALGEDGIWVSKEMVDNLLQRWQESYQFKEDARDEVNTERKEMPNSLNMQRGNSHYVPENPSQRGASGGWVFSYSERKITVVNEHTRTHSNVLQPPHSHWGQPQSEQTQSPAMSDNEDSDNDSLWA